MSSQPRLARIALAHLVESGNRDLGLLVRAVGPVEALDRLMAGDVAEALRQRAALRLRAVSDPYDLAERALTRADRLGVRLVTPHDEEWPAGLDDLVQLSRDGRGTIERDTDPPHCVWVHGGWPVRETFEHGVSLVGSRAATAYGEFVSSEYGHGLADRGWIVVSGGAYGVDAAAHRGTLAAGGRTVAILACGIDRVYPPSHASLFERIREEGMLVSEWPLGADPHRHRFLVRNRMISATCGTVLVEASLRSGGRYTLRRARELGRAVLAVPGPVTSAMSVGCNEELRQEGTAVAARVEHVIEAVGRIGVDLAPPARAEPTARDQLAPLLAVVLDGVRPRKILTAEQIAAAVGVSARDARRALPGLELAGFITADAGGYRLARKSDRRAGRPA